MLSVQIHSRHTVSLHKKQNKTILLKQYKMSITGNAHVTNRFLYTVNLSHCKFCIYTHPVNSKFTIWNYPHAPLNLPVLRTAMYIVRALPPSLYPSIHYIFFLSFSDWTQYTSIYSIMRWIVNVHVYVYARIYTQSKCFL